MDSQPLCSVCRISAKLASFSIIQVGTYPPQDGSVKQWDKSHNLLPWPQGERGMSRKWNLFTVVTSCCGIVPAVAEADSKINLDEHTVSIWSIGDV